jgi:hypothetical protein
MSLPGSTPLQSFLGGVCVAFPVHALLSFNNNTFGISGFIHGAARGRLEDAMSVLGLVLGGAVVAVIEGGQAYSRGFFCNTPHTIWAACRRGYKGPSN